MTRIVSRTPRWDTDDVRRVEVCMVLARQRLHLKRGFGLEYDARPYRILPPVGVGGREVNRS